MKRLLIVAPAFPPHPSPATHRARFLTRYAPEHGWSVEVLTVRPELYAETPDRELEALVPSTAKVTRVGALPLGLTRRLGVSDLGLRSYLSLRRALRDICRRDRPDLLFIPGPPFFPFLLGPAIRRDFGVPYVLDFTDPWAFSPPPGQDRPWRKGYWASRLADALEPAAVRGAAHVLAVSDATNDVIRTRYPEIARDRFSAVPFGFEAEDFAAVRARGVTRRYWPEDDNLHLVYVGVVWAQAQETLRAVFHALVELRKVEPELGRRVRVHFFGTTYDPRAEVGPVMPIAREMGLGDVVSEHVQRIPYLEALQVLTASDAIFALGGTDRHYTASKIFPCILARRPLLAVFHEASTVCDVMRETGTGALVTYNDASRAESRVPQIRAALRALLAPGGYDPTAVRTDALESYSAGAMSERIFATLDEVVGARGTARRAEPAGGAVAVAHG